MICGCAPGTVCPDCTVNFPRCYIPPGPERQAALERLKEVTVPEEKNCRSCLYRCMDMDLQPYCDNDEVRKRMPYGQALHIGTPKECLKDGVHTLWEKDTRGG